MPDSVLYPGIEETEDRRWLFAECEFDESKLELRIRGKPIDLELKPMEVLRVLLRRGDQVTSKEELLDKVWPGLSVVDSSLTTAISKLRKALGDEDSSIVRTVQRVGYRIGVPVRSVSIVHSSVVTPFQFQEGMSVPGREQWKLLRALNTTKNREVWLSENPKTREVRVFKFANTDGSLRSLKREATVSRFLRQRFGDSPEFVRIFEWNFERTPYYLESEYAGQNLADWFEERRSSVPLETRLRLLIAVAKAVASAHDAGVIHQDLKPTNILVAPSGDDWIVKVADFGSASLLEPGKLSEMGITGLGYTRTAELTSSMSGTLLYMAPEVLAGQPPTAASDVYALGVILYQLVVGDFRKPISLGWEAHIQDPLLREDIIEAASGDPARRIKSAADLAERIESLEKRRTERAKDEQSRTRQQILELKREKWRARLPWILISGTALVVAMLAIVLAFRHEAAPSLQNGAVAILPFQNTGTDHSIDFLSLAIPEEVETQLNYSLALPIRPFYLTNKYTQPELDLHRVAHELNATKIVTGTFSRSGEQLEVSLEAIDVQANRLLWQHAGTVHIQDLRAMQGQLAGLTRTELAPSLGAKGSAIDAATHPANEEAYDIYLRSLALAYEPVSVNKQGIELLEKSVRLDDSYAPAWQELGRREYSDSRYGGGGAQADQRFVFALNQVLRLDPGNLQANTSLIVHKVESGQVSEALLEARKLVRQRPDSSTAHFSLGYTLRYAGLLQESAKECDAAFAIDPNGMRSCAVAFIELGNYSRARDFVQINEGEWAHALSIDMLAREGKVSEALQIPEPHIPGWESFNLLRGCMRHEDSAKIAALLAKVKPSDDSETNYFSASHLAYCGQNDAALKMLDRAIDGKYCSYPTMDSDPFFANLRKEPKFAAIRMRAIQCQNDFLHLSQ